MKSAAQNLPNILTWLRIFAVPFFLWACIHKSQFAVVIFIMCAITDGIDGWLARQLKAQSVFGAYLDPIADKLLCNTALLWIVYESKNLWILSCVCILVFRDVIISYIRSNFRDVPVSKLAKLKSVILFFAIVCLLQAIVWHSVLVYQLGFMLLFVSTCLSLWTFVSYTSSNIDNH
ncbi:MAG: CDP-alcohol phosphatidyltransferase family protein [Pseudomonadota bacterium]|nr:CDP-alcohol phosphatidyltransferase family protein [Pseudomonadota bacterium]